MSDRTFRTIVADPPWRPRLHQNTVGRREGPYRAGPQRYYGLMDVEQIEALRPPCARQAHLWLWVLNQHLDWGYRVARAWGFEPQQTITWCRFVFSIMAAFAQFERDVILDRTAHGLAKARERGVVGGAAKRFTDEAIERAYKRAGSIPKAAKLLKCSEPTIKRGLANIKAAADKAKLENGE